MIVLTCPHGVQASGDLTPEQAVSAIHMVCTRCTGNRPDNSRMTQHASRSPAVVTRLIEEPSAAPTANENRNR